MNNCVLPGTAFHLYLVGLFFSPMSVEEIRLSHVYLLTRLLTVLYWR